MNIFILEDDSKCNGVIRWLQDKEENTEIKKNIEDAVYHLLYEDMYGYYDKFIFDASLPGASILYPDGMEKTYYSALNGIDFLADFLMIVKVPIERVVILTAFESQVERYLSVKKIKADINIISKNDNDLTRKLSEFIDH